MLNKPEWKDGKLAGEGYWVNHIPDLAIERAGGWEPLIKRGQQQFNVHCAICHGTSGRGGGADAAYGMVGAYGLSVAPSNLVTPEMQAQPDGQLFNTITNGVRTMPAYAHQVKVQDRWAIVAYLRRAAVRRGECGDGEVTAAILGCAGHQGPSSVGIEGKLLCGTRRPAARKERSASFDEHRDHHKRQRRQPAARPTRTGCRIASRRWATRRPGCSARCCSLSASRAWRSSSARSRTRSSSSTRICSAMSSPSISPSAHCSGR